MSMQYSDGFPRTCPCLTPRLQNLQSGLLKAKGQIQWSSPDTGRLVPSARLDKHSGTMVQENHLMGLVLPTHSRSASQRKKACAIVSAAAEKRRAPATNRYFTAPTAWILSNRSPQRLHTAELDALKLVPDQDPMEGEALAQAHVILAQLKFVEDDHRARRFQRAPPEILPEFNTRSWPPQMHQPCRESRLLNCFRSPVLATSLPRD